MKEVLFICEGNVGRSQMAEAFYNNYKKADLAISAGVDDVGAKYNYIPRADIVLAMREKGIDISHQRIKQVVEEMLGDVSTTVIMCNPDLLPNFDWPNAVFRFVQDPFESSMEGVREVRDAIEKIVIELINSQQ